MSNSLWPHRLQPVRPPRPSVSPGVCPSTCPLNWWCYPTISSSATPFSFCLQSFLATGTFLMSQLFASGGQSIRASSSVLPMSIQGWFPSGLTGLFSLQSKGLSSTTIWKHQFFGAQPSLWSNSHIHSAVVVNNISVSLSTLLVWMTNFTYPTYKIHWTWGVGDGVGEESVKQSQKVQKALLPLLCLFLPGPFSPNKCQTCRESSFTCLLCCPFVLWDPQMEDTWQSSLDGSSKELKQLSGGQWQPHQQALMLIKQLCSQRNRMYVSCEWRWTSVGEGVFGNKHVWGDTWVHTSMWCASVGFWTCVICPRGNVCLNRG